MKKKKQKKIIIIGIIAVITIIGIIYFMTLNSSKGVYSGKWKGQNVYCLDSDGDNKNVAGGISLFLENGTNAGSDADVCEDDSHLIEYRCYAPQGTDDLNIYYYAYEYNCQCSEGACV